jgi:hypothetical protein
VKTFASMPAIILAAIIVLLSASEADARLVRGSGGTTNDPQNSEQILFITRTDETQYSSFEQEWISGPQFLAVPQSIVEDDVTYPCSNTAGGVLCSYEVKAGEKQLLPVTASAFYSTPVARKLSAAQTAPKLEVIWRVVNADGIQQEVAFDLGNFDYPPTSRDFWLPLSLLPGTYTLQAVYRFTLPDGFAFYQGAGLCFGDIRGSQCGTLIGRKYEASPFTRLTIEVGAKAVDITPPATVATVTPAPAAGADGWNKTPVTVSFTATDLPAAGDNADSSGVELISYVVSGAESATDSPPGASASVGIAAEGASRVDFAARDVEGNQESLKEVSVKLDLTAPSITSTLAPANADNWYNTSVTASFSCEDALSGVKSCSPDPQALEDEGAGQQFAVTAADTAGNTRVANYGPINIDRTQPTVQVTGVTDGAAYVLGQAPEAACSTADTLSGVGQQATLSITGGTASGAGSFTARCSGATDKAGNVGPEVSVNYQVNFGFVGFFSPIENAPVLNRVKAGQAVPVRFSLSGDHGLNVMAAGYPRARPIACDSGAGGDDVVETVSASSSGLSYDASTGQYIYVWKTPKNFARSCQVLELKFTDGTTRSANFSFR